MIISFSFTVFAGLLAFAFTVVGLDPFIKYLKTNYIGQYIREDGPQEHHSKKGTPTMGGVIILIAIILSTVFVLLLEKSFNMTVVIVIASLIILGLLGFADDYSKVIKKHNKGITGWTKLLIQFLVALVVTGYVYYFLDRSSVSIYGLTEVNLGLLIIPFGIIVILGSSNGINLTDGLDGLASLTSAVSFLTLAIFLYNTNNIELAIVSIAISGSCLGFLVYNHHPAKIFMGDAGSLMLGGAFGILGVLGGLELWLIPIGIIFVVECLSVIIQVISFKSTGKRVFKMTPLHHHFELCGDNETTVVKKFVLVQVIACILSVIAGYKWLF
ncbi:MAG: phospho-N-acetylmuramoyl-pentapeptide-transferase [Cyanobacteriota bacterium]